MSVETIVGLEVHVQLMTKTKIFCSCANSFGDPPNTNICPVCLGLPGSLPVLNRRALELATIAALALDGEIAPRMKFDRKNYFYADLPKGYQISQFDLPLATGGGVTLAGGRQIRLTRIHLEEDAGKLLHTAESLDESEFTRVDLNRAGTPLIEIVSEPDIRLAEEAHEYLTILKRKMLYAEVSDCNMEEGSLRCDANVSLRPAGDTKLGVKVEVKNLNSFKAVHAAINYESERQRKLLESGERIVQETRLWDADRGVSRSMRSKEESHDYRYFPEPDLVAFNLSRDFVESCRGRIPEGPAERAKRFVNDLGISEKNAGILVQAKPLAEYFEKAAAAHPSNPTGVANWIVSEFLRVLQGNDPSHSRVAPEAIAELVSLVDAGRITGKMAKDIFPEMLATGKAPAALVAEKGLEQISDEGELKKVCEEVIAENPGPVSTYKGGKTGAFGFFVGQVMKKTKGTANPQLANSILKDLLR